MPEYETSGDIPTGLVYASQDATAVQAVSLSVPGAERVVAVVEPGHDAALQWKMLRSFLAREGIPDAAPYHSHSPGDSPTGDQVDRVADR
jgi:hypothetical protein